MNSLLKSILKTAVYIIDQADDATDDVRDRVRHRAERVSEKLSDVADRGRAVIYGEDHTLRNLGILAAGFGVGVAAGMLLAPASGEEIRSSMRDKVEDMGDRMRDRFSSTTRPRSTGTEGGV